MTSKKSNDDSRLGSRLQQTPIAVIGMACLFPEASNVREFWDNIVKKRDAIREVPRNRWNVDDYYDPDPKAPDKTYCKRGGFLPDVDFDPMEFGMPPNILEVTDVSQMLSLIVAKAALEDARYGESSGFDRDRIGVILGVGGGQKLITPLTTRLQYPVWKEVLTKSGISEQDADIMVDKIRKAYVPWEENSFPGMLGNVIAGRIANRLNLGGTNCVVDAACASSLTALKMAVSELLEYRSDIMLTGGVDTDNSIFMYMCFSKTPAFTVQEFCSPFDIDSSGMMVGEGIGMAALKRLDEAERDNDRIYAVIRGIGTSSDGRFSSIYNPRPEGQAKALKRAYEDADIVPSSVGLVEAHGTGTKAGDPAEVKALRDFFGMDNGRKQHIALGSVKSQIGHTKAAAGSAGFIKAAMALHHKILPPTINVKEPNPKFELDDSPFYVNTETRPWIHTEDGLPRRAAVSSFGFGGTNFHVVLEEYQPKATGSYRLHEAAHSLLLSASTPEALQEECKRVLVDLDAQDAEKKHRALVESCRTAEITSDAARVGFVSESLDETRERLKAALDALTTKTDQEAWNLPKGVYYRKNGMDLDGKVVALFSGQGSQYIEMGKEVACNFPILLDAFRDMDRLFAADGKAPLSETVFPRPAFDPDQKKTNEENLRNTEFAQPAIGVLSAGMFKILSSAGFKPDLVAGHSFGELTALWAAQVLSDEDYFALARARGKAMAAPEDPGFDAGTMLAVIGDVEAIRKSLDKGSEVTVANLNSKQEVVLAGPTDAVAGVQEPLKAEGFRVVPLPVSAAFHTRLVGHAQKPFAKAIRAAEFRSPQCPVYSNTTGRPHDPEPKAIQKTLEEHILNPVLFKEEIENIYADGGRLFVEFGPKGVLTKLVGNILEGKPHVAVALNASPKRGSDRQLRQAIVELRVVGLSLGNIDPYGSEEPVEDGKARGPATVTLTGSNYVSAKTLKAFEDALEEGHRVEGPVDAAPDPAPAKSAETVAVPKPGTPASAGSRAQQSQVSPPVGDQAGTPPATAHHGSQQAVPARNPVQGSERVLESLEKGLDLFFKHQGETLKVHEQYLNHHLEYTRTFYDLMRQQSSLPGGGLPERMTDALERSMAGFHEHQGETLRVHEQYLKSQAEVSKSALDVLRGQSSLTETGGRMPVSTEAVGVQAPSEPVAPPVERTESVQASAAAPVAAPVEPAAVAPAPAVVEPTGPGIAALTESMLQVVSEKTGYPVEMLELDMEMEADLGIDSIKRVEILGTMMDLYPNLPEMNPEELAELKTLAQIVEHMESCLPSGGGGVPAAASVAASPEVAVAAAAGPGIAALTESMLQVVSEKTGYPVEMLELDMEMEADLGIDSIKRVEILGTMMDLYPNLPEMNPEELAELKTLGQIVEHMESCLPSGGAAVPQAAPVAASPGVSAPAAAGPGIAALTESMLQVVSEKTGYPVEMLELDMEMEADLGIDSIKRVEILGTMMDLYPDLPEMNPEELAELKTLGQIVEHMESTLAGGVASQSAGPVTATPGAAAPAAAGPGIAALTESMLQVVSEKTGYPVEMLELDMEMEADLGIDSIKRVEILGTMMDLYPNLPEMNPEELAELKTLGQIVGHMESTLSGGVESQAAASVPASPEVAAPVAAGPGIAALTESMLQVVSEKTGYPVEMLELDMEMEADLGIDSIKRVEILGTMMDLYPNLPEMNPEELAELKTLGQIVAHMESTLSGGGGVSEATVQEASPSAEKTPEGSTVATGVPQGYARLEALPVPDALECVLPAGHVCVVTDDGTSRTVGLAEALVEKDWKVVVLSFPSSTIPEGPASAWGVPRVELKDLSEKHLKEKLQEIEDRDGPIGGLIHLNPEPGQDGEDRIVFSTKGRDLLLHVFLMAKHLQPALTREPPDGRPFVLTVTGLDGELGVGGGDFSAVDGGFFGLVKTLNLEWGPVFCRALDLSPELDDAGSISAILQELADPDLRIVEVGRGARGRVTLVPEPSVPPEVVEPDPGVTESSVFVVSGGAKGVTASCVVSLAAEYKCKFVLVGRSPFSGDEPDWARGCFDPADLKKHAMEAVKASGEKPTPKKVEEAVKPVLANREISATLESIRKAGGEAEYVQADVTDKEALEQIGPAVDRLGELTGLIHGAGVLADRLIEKKTAGDFQSVYATKIEGLEALLDSVDNRRLRYLILFSSAAGFFGNPGQSDYSMANEILNKVAYQFRKRHPDCHVRSFNWGPWDGGMVSDSLKKLFEERNIQVIPIDGGTRVFVQGFSRDGEDNPQVLVGSSMQVEGEEVARELKSHRISRTIHLDDNPFLQDHVIGGHPVLPAACVIGWMADGCEQLYPGYRLARCDDYRTLKGIAFDRDAAEEYAMEIEEAGKGKSGEIEFVVKVSSRSPRGKAHQHYSGRVLLTSRMPEGSVYSGFEGGGAEIIEGASFYGNGTLFHGPRFQVVERVVRISEEGLKMECRLPTMGPEDQGQFPVRGFNPYAADALFQAMLVWVRRYRDAGSLPSKVATLEHGRSIPGDREFYVSLEVRNNGRASLIADVTAHDQAGNVYCRMLGAEVTISKKLNDQFRRAT